MAHDRPFLTAQWRHLAMLNFAVDPGLLQPFIPAGTELDTWQGETYLSLVGFLFRDMRVHGLPIPFHRQFEEVNLRFYVRRRAAEGWRRGVVFIKELAPRRLVVWAARWLYGENYVRLPMAHRIDVPNGKPDAVRHASYGWTLVQRANRLEVTSVGEPRLAGEGTLEQFITAQYWGYSGGNGRSTIEYRVEHPAGQIWTAGEFQLTLDAAELYGPQFVAPLAAPPASAYLVDGSPVTVFRGQRLTH